MASEELELRQRIAEAKAEERTYEEFNEEQNIDGINDYLEDVNGNLPPLPFYQRQNLTIRLHQRCLL